MACRACAGPRQRASLAGDGRRNRDDSKGAFGDPHRGDLATAPAGLARWPAGTVVAGLHGLAIWALWSGLPPAASPPRPLPMQVRMLQAAPAPAPTPAPVQPAKPLPQTSRPAPAAACPACCSPPPAAPPAAARFQAAPAPRPVVAPARRPRGPRRSAPPGLTPTTCTTPPRPIRPCHDAMAKKAGCSLSVRVSAQGRAEQVDVRHSSGYPRLDDAAAATVRQWRFV